MQNASLNETDVARYNKSGKRAAPNCENAKAI